MKRRHSPARKHKTTIAGDVANNLKCRQQVEREGAGLCQPCGSRLARKLLLLLTSTAEVTAIPILFLLALTNDRLSPMQRLGGIFRGPEPLARSLRVFIDLSSCGTAGGVQSPSTWTPNCVFIILSAFFTRSSTPTPRGYPTYARP